MSRRVHANAHEFDNTAYNSENFQENFNYYESSQDFQQNYNYESNIHYGGPQNVMNSAPHGQNPDYNNHYSNNNMNFHESGANHQTSNNGAYNHISQDRHSPVIKASFPIVQPPALVQPTGPIQNYGTQYNSASNSEKSWISAFGSGGFDNEPPLLEELGINFSHIKDKTLASLNPFRKLDSGSLNDADLTGPLLFCFLFGTSLLLSGKVHFGYIYGVATLGWISIFTILNLMTENGVSFYLTASILGYCLLPMVLLSAIAVLLKLRGILGLILGVTSVSWCTFSSSTYFVTAFGMHNQQVLIAYPIFLLYSCFALMTIF